MKPVPVQVAITTTQIKCIYGKDMDQINLQDYVKNADAVEEVSVKVATVTMLVCFIQLEGGFTYKKAKYTWLIMLYLILEYAQGASK